MSHLPVADRLSLPYQKNANSSPSGDVDDNEDDNDGDCGEWQLP